MAKFEELCAPEIKFFPISKKGTPFIFFCFAISLYELIFSIFSELKNLLIIFSFILNRLPILINIALFPISRPFTKYD